ncbi:MAG: glycosyl hydrolase [Armatimonadota bacterium]
MTLVRAGGYNRLVMLASRLRTAWVLASILALALTPVLCRPLAKFEPLRGCYVGAFIQLDSTVKGDFQLFESLTGKKHASYFRYLGYGKPFPKEWAERVKAAGAVPHIAVEPNEGLDKVRDNEYLRQWARDAAELGCPIFLRFASEMNGTWMPYSGNPKLFIEKWRLVHDVLERLAPNVAMVWTPFATPLSTIPKYYPGDEYVDWVGVNIYSVYRHDGDPSKPAGEDPRELLRYVYRRYGDRKPIQISEYAASHYCAAAKKSIVDFAVARMSVLYRSLERDLPNVKMINWFSVDAAQSGLAHNDYSLTSQPKVLETYRRLVASPYFLSQVQPIRIASAPPGVGPATPGPSGPGTPSVPPAAPWTSDLGPEPQRGVRLLLQGASMDVLRGAVGLIADVGTEEPVQWVSFKVDGRMVSLRNAPPYRFAWDTTRAANGTHELTVVALDAASRELASDELLVDVDNG